MEYPDYSQGKKRGTVFQFSPESFSFIVDQSDESFKNTLRRKSLTGETGHPLSWQITSKVQIPVQHCDENEDIFTRREYNLSRVTSNKARSPRKDSSKHHVHSTGRRHNINKGSDNSYARDAGTQKTIPIPVERLDNDATLQGSLANLNIETTRPKYRNEESYSSPHTPLAYAPTKYEDRRPIKNDLQSNDTQNEKGSGIAHDLPPYDPYAPLKVSANSIIDDKENQATTKKKKSSKNTTEDYQSEIEAQDKFIKKNYNLHRFVIIPDGNCLYRAVAQAVLLDQGQHELLRQLTVDHIKEHKEEFKDIIEGDVDEFLAAAQLEGVWAGYPEILALSRWLDININITTGGTASNPNVCTALHYFPPADEKNSGIVTNSSQAKKNEKFMRRQSIWLSWLSSGHYDMLSEKKLKNPYYEEWLESRESRIKSDAAMANQISNEGSHGILDNRVKSTGFHSSASTAEDTSAEQQSFASIENNPINYELQNTNLNKLLYSDGIKPSCSLHTYPAATYSRLSPIPSTPPRTETPPSGRSNTELDEDIARALQKEEDDAYLSYSSKYA